MPKHPRRIMDQLDDILDDLKLLKEEYPSSGFIRPLRKAMLAVREAKEELSIVKMHFGS